MLGINTISRLLNRDETYEYIETRPALIPLQGGRRYEIDNYDSFDGVPVRYLWADDENGPIYAYGYATATGPNPYAIWPDDEHDYVFVEFTGRSDWLPIWAVERVDWTA
jgi:hypothetical protein